MVGLSGESLNLLFEELSQWNLELENVAALERNSKEQHNNTKVTSSCPYLKEHNENKGEWRRGDTIVEKTVLSEEMSV